MKVPVTVPLPSLLAHHSTEEDQGDVSSSPDDRHESELRVRIVGARVSQHCNIIDNLKHDFYLLIRKTTIRV